MTISGQTLSALGVQQQVEFGRIAGPNPEERLKEYVLGRFLNTSSWVYPDGDLGGFTIQQMLYRDADGTVRPVFCRSTDRRAGLARRSAPNTDGPC